MNTPPDPILIAAAIFIRATVNVMNARSKPWALKPREAEALARAALDAGQLFCQEAARSPEPTQPANAPSAAST